MEDFEDRVRHFAEFFEVRGHPSFYYLVYTGEIPQGPEDARAMSVAKWECLAASAQDGLVVAEGGGRTCGFCLYFIS